MHPHKVNDIIEVMRERINGEYKYVNIGWEGYKGDVRL